MAMEVSYAGKIRPEPSAPRSVVPPSGPSTSSTSTSILSRLGAKPVQSRLGPPPGTANQQQPTPQSSTQQGSKKQKKGKKKDAAKEVPTDPSKDALDNDLDRYMKQPHKAPDPRQMISYEDMVVTPMAGEDSLLT